MMMKNPLSEPGLSYIILLMLMSSFGFNHYSLKKYAVENQFPIEEYNSVR